MGMFMGEYQHNIDVKGRIIVPAKFRSGLGEQFVLTRGLDQCLFAYPMEEWKILESKLKNLPLTKKDARSFTRFFFSGAIECEVDIIETHFIGHLQTNKVNNVLNHVSYIHSVDRIKLAKALNKRAKKLGKKLNILIQVRSEEHTSELQSRGHLVCRLLLEKKKYNKNTHI